MESPKILTIVEKSGHDNHGYSKGIFAQPPKKVYSRSCLFKLCGVDWAVSLSPR